MASPALLRVATAGSVDDGKSTLIGRLFFDTQSILDDQLAAIKLATEGRGEKDINLALLTDGLRAEREQNITIDVAYRPFQSARRRFLIADSPGHAQYTRNMVTAASTADVAIILVDASRGLTSQSRRHLAISLLLGVPRIVILVNKMDLAGFSESRFEELRGELERAYEAIANIETHAPAHERLTFIPISALLGDNVARASTNMAWYSGRHLLELLETVDIPQDTGDGFSMSVQCVVRGAENYRGFAGMPASGRIAVGDRVTVLPSMRESTVRSIFSANGAAEAAIARQPANIQLQDELDISRGDMLVGPGAAPTATSLFEGSLCWLDSEPMRVGMTYRLVHGTRTVAAVVKKVVNRLDVETMSLDETPLLGMNEIGSVVLSTTQPLFLETFSTDKRLGSFILVDPHNHTVAAGMVDRVAAESEVEVAATKSAVVWLTGLSGAGKSTIAYALEARLRELHRQVTHLDGDELRTGLNSDLGFSDEDRLENVRRTAEVAKLFSERGLITICSLISPLRSYRDMARSIVGEGFTEVYVRCDIDECRRRDPKGLYRRADAGELPGFTGVSAPYEPPERPELTLDTDKLPLEECVKRIVSALR